MDPHTETKQIKTMESCFICNRRNRVFSDGQHTGFYFNISRLFDFEATGSPGPSLWAPVVQVTFQVYSDRVCPNIS